jgi:hypothetical protein
MIKIIYVPMKYTKIRTCRKCLHRAVLSSGTVRCTKSHRRIEHAGIPGWCKLKEAKPEPKRNESPGKLKKATPEPDLIDYLLFGEQESDKPLEAEFKNEIPDNTPNELEWMQRRTKT